MISNITVIILAGGKSSRIGTNKAFLKLNGQSIIEKIYDLLSNIFSNIIIISNELDDFRFLTPKVYNDIYPSFGPLSGLHSGLKNSHSEYNFIISCDMPLITEEAIRFIVPKMYNTDIVIYRTNNNIHPLLGVYKKSCLPIAEELLKTAQSQKNNSIGKSKVKLFDLINSVNTLFIDPTEEDFYFEDLFLNMNTLENYRKVKDILAIEK